MTRRTNTADNSPKTGKATGRPFQKGDPRINRKGRPRPFDAFRILAQKIANEEVLDGEEPRVIDGHVVTLGEELLRIMASSRNHRDRALFLEYAYGKPPVAVEVTGQDGGPLAYRDETVQDLDDDALRHNLDALARVAAQLAAVGRDESPQPLDDAPTGA